ncbi:putative cystatin-9-like protein CST9LP1 [Arvicanthis niloticus]|uniref:putative cystatin-9-like protein CST9LP1 n=1 Tax=Arvicanthis niloticus TaxID=61156 RepID=UPI0014864C85|nr:putative cystatin-9-like protein CST9LP1 [Arvicanthis niloticus]
MAVPWKILLVLSGIYIQAADTWCSLKDKIYIDKPVSNPDVLKFALSAFNNQSKDEYAYRLMEIMTFFQVQEKPLQTFFLKLRLTRTICKKFEESLDTCPLPELENILTCSFSIKSPGSKHFNLLKMTCSEGLL